MKRTDINPFPPWPKMGSGQAGRQDDRRTGKDCRASENGKLPELYNQLGTFDHPELRHQLPWDNRQPLRGLTSYRHCGHNGSVTSRQRPGQHGSQSQKPAVSIAEMLHEGGQTDKQHSEAIVPLLSTQHSGTLTSQTSLSADHLVVEEWCNGGVCKPATAHAHILSLYNETYVEQMCTHMLLAHLCV